MKSRFYVGPVTALAFIGDDLLAGHGSELRWFDHSGPQTSLRWRKRIFKRERIQGIQISSPVKSEEHDTTVLLWGGKRFQIIRLLDLLDPNFSTYVEEEIPAPDWILHSVFLEAGGQTPRIAMITAHNTILTYRHDPGIELASRYTWYPSPERCLLYSATLTLFPTSPTCDILVAIAGTVFGEVLVWKLNPFQEQVPNSIKLSARYLSHEGSVFGVSISPDSSYAASCSDDRTIRLWDIREGVANSECSREINEFLAIGWGHQARVWGVRFLQVNDEQVRMISFSEDLTAKIWSWDINGSKSLHCIQTFKSLHSASGKNIWSLAVHSSGKHFVTGGSDSGIASWNISKDLIDMSAVNETIAKLEDIVPFLTTAEGRIIRPEPRKYVALGSRSFMVITSSGWLLHCKLLESKFQWQKVGLWPQIRNSSAMGAGILRINDACHYIVALGDNTGRLLLQTWRGDELITATGSSEEDWIQVCDSRPSEILFSHNQHSQESNTAYAAITTFSPDKPVRLLQINIDTSGRPTIQMSWMLTPPDTFPFTTILVYTYREGMFCLAGSRHGALAIYSISVNDSTVKLLDTWRHVHDDESVTSLAFQDAPKNSTTGTEFELFLKSTGRSGAIKSHKLLVSMTQQQFNLIETNAVYPAAVPRVESFRGRLGDLDEEHELIYGFKGRDFVIWNQTLGFEIASYDCEGGNRSWDFSFGTDSDTQDEGLFVFTKAGRCYAVEFKKILHNPLLQTPFHGREIKALAISSNGIIATGAEDTIIRLSFVRPGTSELVPLTFRKTHTSGIQDLVWSPCGGWLFSSGSVEEVYCWKINVGEKLQPGTVGMLREAVYEISTDGLPDLRVCGLDVATIYSSTGDHYGFLLGMVRSDSSIRLALYDIVKKKFITIAEGYYKTSCLLQIRFHITTFGSIMMLTAGTDGYITVWDITEKMSSRSISATSTGSSGSRVLSMNGHRASSLNPAKLDSDQWILSQSFHQNSIKTLELHNQEGDEVLMLTGGDDTAISVSRLVFQQYISGPGTKVGKIRTKLMERTHASAVTAITVLDNKSSDPDQSGKEVEFLSSGIDQQVKRWHIGLGDDLAIEAVDMVEDIYVNVPDVSSIELIGRLDNACRLVVGGVGVEVLEI